MVRKGISPLIAGVLLIAFTMTVAIIAGPFFSDVMKSSQEDSSEKAQTLVTASQLRLSLKNIKYNRSTQNLTATVQNTGQEPIQNTNISLAALGSTPKQKIYDKQPRIRQITNLDLKTSKTFSISQIQTSLTNYPVSTQKDVKCTPTEGLVGYWTFNNEQTDTANNKTLDLSQSSIDGKLFKEPITGQDGVVGESYEFEGDKRESEINITTSKYQYGKNDDFTISGWIKYNGAPDRDDWDTMGALNQGSYDDSYGIEIHGGRADDKVVRFAVRDENSDASIVNHSISKSEYFHVIGVHDSEQETIELYVNGNKIGQNSTSSINNFKNNENFYIGSSYVVASGSDSLNGEVDEVRIYNRSLSQQEIQRLHNVRDKDWAVDACKFVN